LTPQCLHPQTLNNKYYHPSAIFQAKIANLTIFYGPKLQTLHSAIFCEPKLQTLHNAIFLAKIANLPMTHNYPSPSYTQETYWVVVTTPKPTLYFYSIFLLLSSSYYLMWDFGEYPLENQHILLSPKVSHAMKQTFDTMSTNFLELLLLLVIYTNTLTMTIFPQWPSLPCTSDSLSNMNSTYELHSLQRKLILVKLLLFLPWLETIGQNLSSNMTVGKSRTKNNLFKQKYTHK